MGVPVLVVKEDTMSTVERVEQLFGRVRIREAVKVDRAVDLVEQHVDVGGVLSSLQGTRGPRG